MNVVCVVFVVLVLALFSNGAVFFFKTTNPDHPGKCFLEGFGPIEPGKEAYNKKDCSRITCSKTGDTEFLGEIATCGLKGLNPAVCKPLPQDYSKAYPDCCLTYECLNEDGKKIIV